MTLHRSTCVFPTPSKIPYGGFSPVRLQTEIPPQPSRSPPRLSVARIPPAATAYMRLKLVQPASAAHLRAYRNGTGQSDPNRHVGQPPRTVPSRGPWLASGLCCPTRSMLTMASSETLELTPGLMNSPRGLLVYRPDPTELERFPTFLRASVPSCHPPYPGGSDGCTWLSFTVHIGLRLFRRGSASTHPPSRFAGGRVTRLQGSLDATAQGIACLAPTKACTFELSPPRSLPNGVEYNYAGISRSRDRTCTG